MALKSIDYGAAEVLEGIMPRLSKDQQQVCLETLVAIEDTSWARRDCLAKSIPHLDPDLLLYAAEIALKSVEYKSEELLKIIMPRIADADVPQIFTWARSYRPEALQAVASRLSAGLLTEALKVAAEITDMETRGSVLAALIPRFREMRLPMAVADAYTLAFVISDRDIAAFALAALAPYLALGNEQSAIATASEMLKKAPPSRDEEKALRVAASALLAAQLPSGDARRALDRTFAITRNIGDRAVRLMAIGLLAPRLPSADRESAFAEAVRLARLMAPDAVEETIWLAPVLPESDATALLEEAQRIVENMGDPSKRSLMTVMILLAKSLLPGRSQDQRRAAVNAAHSEARRLVKLDNEQGAIALLAIAAFSPALPDQEWEVVLTDAMTLVQESKDKDKEKESIVFLAAYLPDAQLADVMSGMLEWCARRSRPEVLGMLAFTQGLAKEIYWGNQVVAGNRIAGSPIERLGGPAAVEETVQAIQDVCHWWP